MQIVGAKQEYHHENIHLYLIDCMEGMKQVPDKYFSLACPDPPYGINAPNMNMGSNPNRNEPGQYGGTTTAVKLKNRLNDGAGKLKNRAIQKMTIEWDFNKPDENYFKELFRISTNQIIWGGNYFPLPPTRGIAVWDKMQPWDNFSQCELAWTSFDYPAKLKSLSSRGGANNEAKIHPTQKPVGIYRWLFKNYAKQGDSIVDTHGGSFSSAVAVHEVNKSGMNLSFVGMEISADYFTASVKRFKTITSQTALAF